MDQLKKGGEALPWVTSQAVGVGVGVGASFVEPQALSNEPDGSSHFLPAAHKGRASV